MKPTILVVEDDPKIAALVGKNLEAAGFAVRAAADGRGGLDLYRAVKPDLLVLDVMLPGIDGLELTRRVRRVG